MAKKTETLRVTKTLDGKTLESTVESFKNALIALENESVRVGRIPLYDTLEVSIEREQEVDSLIVGRAVVATYTTIELNVLGVLQ